MQQIQLGATSDALDGTFMVDFANAGGFVAAWDISASDMEVRAMVSLTVVPIFCRIAFRAKTYSERRADTIGFISRHWFQPKFCCSFITI